MFDVTRFLLRWLYLSHMVRDISEIQTLPYHPIQMQVPTNLVEFDSNLQKTVEQSHYTDKDVSNLQRNINTDDEWKDRCIRGVLSYPPGSQRLFALDSLRMELVQQLAHHLRASDTIVKRYSMMSHEKELVSENHSLNDDPSLDADLDVLKAFAQATSIQIDTNVDNSIEGYEGERSHHALTHGESSVSHSHSVGRGKGDMGLPSETDLSFAFTSLATFRDYLPQLVSVILTSPPALQPALLDPVQKLRRVLLTRCLQDANWGIELCWLLEAEVGRAWKTLFEHRQQTGRRLIVVLPADKAAVLARIGMAKREAFELLQDAEQATAYGNTAPFIEDPSSILDLDLEPFPSRLPSSLSLRRCSHYGDTMHLIDRLTQISMDLRMIPSARRHQCLVTSLEEINRRLRRRMVTRGDISLDVDDNLEPHDWPHISDVSVDMLKYSVHLPLEPKKLVWPGGEYQESDTLHMAADRSRAGVMRVLNVITSECRILSSRERCPYLVHVEVAETGMEGNDARLYASGAHDLGTTIGETLGMQPNGKENFEGTAGGFVFGKALPMYKIPSELLIHNDILHECESKQQNPQLKLQAHDSLQRQDLSFPERGGWQSHEGYPINERYDQRDLHFFQQQRYEEVDPSLMIPSESHSYPQVQNSEILPSFTTSSTLLDRVFGLPWALKCEQLRQASPYGKVNGWRLASFILKAGEDIRREALVMQVISSLNSWFKSDIPESLRPKMRPYTIMCVGGDAGLLECLSDAKSVDEVKKKTDGFTTLREYFERAYGSPQSQGANLQQPLNSDSSQGPSYPGISFETAQDNFLRSLVGYSLVCYILQIKDRHNANILMDREGHIMHIDFGYVLGDTPKMGKVPIFSERAPFKLSMEFWEVLGGWNYNRGGLGVKFCKMFEKAFACASSHSDEIVSLVEAALMNLTRNHNTAKTLANGIRHRLRMRGPPESVEQKTFVMELVNTALTCWSTTTYDWLQKNMNGYQ